MRTQKQIVDKIESIKKNDFFGFQTSDLVFHLEYEHAKQYLNEGVTADQWKQMSPDRDSILKEMQDYMPFAWDKANNFRGLSAGRSMSHYMAWVWLAGDEANFGDLEDYEYYGKDNLVRICKFYGWDSSQWDDGVRSNSEE